MSDFFGKLKSGAGKVAFEADKMARLNKAQNEQGATKRKIEEQYHKLGELYYQGYTSQQLDNPEFASICGLIADLQAQVTAKDEEVQRIHAETYSPPGAAPAPSPLAPIEPIAAAAAPAPLPVPAPAEAPAPEAPQKRFCTNCGKEVPAGVKFCPDCGTKMV